MCITSTELVSFDAAETLVQEFRRLLSDNDISIPDDSESGIACGKHRKKLVVV